MSCRNRGDYENLDFRYVISKIQEQLLSRESSTADEGLSISLFRFLFIYTKGFLFVYIQFVFGSGSSHDQAHGDPVMPEDLEKIEQKMQGVCRADLLFQGLRL